MSISSPSGPPFNFLPKNVTANISGWGQLQGVKRVEISQGQESQPNFECGGVSFWRRLCLDRGHWDRCHVLVWCAMVWWGFILTKVASWLDRGHWGDTGTGAMAELGDGWQTEERQINEQINRNWSERCLEMALSLLWRKTTGHRWETISKQDLFLDHDDPQPEPPFAVKIRLIISSKTYLNSLRNVCLWRAKIMHLRLKILSLVSFSTCHLSQGWPCHGESVTRFRKDAPSPNIDLTE